MSRQVAEKVGLLLSQRDDWIDARRRKAVRQEISGGRVT
jgi:hypothetical protein